MISLIDASMASYLYTPQALYSKFTVAKQPAATKILIES